MNCSYIYFLLIPLIISLIIGNPLIKILKSLNAKQTIREDGPSSHKITKSKVPTIGGLIFLIPVFLITICSLLVKDFQNTNLITVLLVTFAMATLGFADDLLKVLKKHNKGVSGWMKLSIQLLVSIILFLIYKEEAGLLYLILVFFVIAGSSNSYNLTDGLDGLLAGISLVSFIGFAFLFNSQNNQELTLLSIAFIGSLLGFLFFNRHPAKIFMGDTGSLALGGAIGSLAIVSRTELFLAFFATIPILEAISVILQVLSYKLSMKFLGKDKRLFKMAPLHHHFELSGWSEVRVVRRFIILQLIFMLIGIGCVLWLDLN